MREPTPVVGRVYEPAKHFKNRTTEPVTVVGLNETPLGTMVYVRRKSGRDTGITLKSFRQNYEDPQDPDSLRMRARSGMGRQRAAAPDSEEMKLLVAGVNQLLERSAATLQSLDNTLNILTSLVNAMKDLTKIVVEQKKPTRRAGKK